MSSLSLADSRRDVGVQGYDKLALFIGNYPRMMIFRTFSTLSAKYGLYLQAELSHLEKDFEDASYADSRSDDPERQNYHKSWWCMNRARPGEDWQIKKVNEVGKVLNKYYKWMHLQKDVGKLDPARSTDIHYLRNWMENPLEGNNFLAQTTYEKDVLEKPDLVSLCVNESVKEEQMDTLTKWIHDMLPWFHKHKPQPAEVGIGEIYSYSSERITRTISMVSTILAALWPITAIFILNVLSYRTTRLALTILFTLLFALTVSVIAAPTRVQLFAATSAYVLKYLRPKNRVVEVVFADTSEIRYAAILVAITGSKT
ncbi:hypothetical protein GP486_004669 [Trichoglossum hirsutum]|uniref:DUF6594 domain-containing protein n=1 Tax=Trichoglossum hirsutum TaxID=265104 RepID=A0A9P8LAN0_9PEZI|nr:hypothetical protein GP486_004669 [Trichoglossum hirsutum]